MVELFRYRFEEFDARRPRPTRHHRRPDRSRVSADGASTTLADLFTPLQSADLSSAVRASLIWRSKNEFDDGLAHGRQTRLWRWAVVSFSGPLWRCGGAVKRRILLSGSTPRHRRTLHRSRAVERDISRERLPSSRTREPLSGLASCPEKRHVRSNASRPEAVEKDGPHRATVRRGAFQAGV